MLSPADIRPGRKPGLPAGPPLFFRMLTRQMFGTRLRQNPAEFMRSCVQEYGDLVTYSLGGHRIYVLSHPALIADFFGKDAPRHHRNLVMQRSRDVLGNGLLTSEEPLHMRQRRLANPAFLRSRIAGYGDVIAEKTLTLTATWQSGTVVEMHAQMLELALRIVSKCLFDLDEFDDLHAMENAVSSFMAFMPLAFIPFSRYVQASPLPSMRRLRKGQHYLDTLIYRLIAERRADPRDRGDLLSMLLNAADDGTDPKSSERPVAAVQGTTASEAGAPHPAAEAGDRTSTETEGKNPELKSAEVQTMSDQQLRDECVTVILAGHETTANALSFAVHLLAQHLQVQQRLHEEAKRVLGTRAPTAADYPALAYATQVFAETMRLYPPVWVTGRLCAEPYEIAGYTIPKGASLMAPQFAVHRDPRWWPDPDTFDPERFTEAAKAERTRAGMPRYTYYPFGGGSRQCIAEGLAWLEGTLCLALIARDWQLTPAPGSAAEPVLDPAISLRPKHGIPLRIDRR